MTVDRSVYRLGQLCNVVALRDSVRHLRGLSYQADRRAELLQCAWPDRRTPELEAAITAAILHAQAMHGALTHQLEVLELVTGEEAS